MNLFCLFLEVLTDDNQDIITQSTQIPPTSPFRAKVKT